MLESALLQKIVEQAIDKMDEKEINKLCKENGINVTEEFLKKKQLLLIALQTAIKAYGFKAFQIAVIIANAVAKFILGRGLSFGANAALTRGMGFLAGPIGWAVSGLWAAKDIAGPAFRVTIPACIQVSFLRLQNIHGTEYEK